MTGKDLERLIAKSAQHGERHGLLCLEKVDPPVAVHGPKNRKKVIFLENPWLDFTGAWTEAGGRAIVIEAKAIVGLSLAVNRAGGVTAAQYTALIRWAHAGAVAGVIWWDGSSCKWITAAELEAAVVFEGKKSIRTEKCAKIETVWIGNEWILNLNKMLREGEAK